VVPEKQEEALHLRGFLSMERTGIEPVTSGLQSHPVGRHHLTPINRIGMTKPKSSFSSNVARQRWTAVRLHRACTAAA
jgi:hypothetical protein